MNSTTAVTRLTSLAQETRLAIFRLLVETGPDGLCAGDIQSRLRVAPATLSFHLKELAHAGMVAARQDGRFIYYSPNLKAMNALIAYLTKNCCGGEPCEVESAPRVNRAAA